MDSITHLKREFESSYGEAAESIYFAPGRVNLIGEHIDYNGGLVFPCALTVGTYLAIRLRQDEKVCLRSLNFEETYCGKLTEIEKTGQWFDYPLGVLKALESRGAKFSGIEMLFYGTIPNGAGLSSSASIEVVTAYALSSVAKLGLGKEELVKIAQQVENSYIGVNCGIMDQFAVGMGKKNHAIALNCDTLNYDYVPLEPGAYTLLIGNTRVQRKLADSKYNERLAECRKALKIIQKKHDVNELCELNLEALEAMKGDFSEELLYKRAHHVVSEQERVEKAIQLLKDNDLEGFGALMNASHDSLQKDYEVTGEALDTMVAEGRKIAGVLGTRMTGAGFGGCTVTLLHEESVDIFIEEVGTAYEQALKIKPEFYTVGVGDGVLQII